MLPKDQENAEWVRVASEYRVAHPEQQSVVSDAGASMPFPAHVFDSNTFEGNNWASPFSRLANAEHDGKGNEQSLEWNYLSWQDRSAMSAANSLEERLPTLHARLMSRRQIDACTFISARSNAVQPSQASRLAYPSQACQATEPCVFQGTYKCGSQTICHSGSSTSARRSAEGPAQVSTSLISSTVAVQPHTTAVGAPTGSTASGDVLVSRRGDGARRHNTSPSSHTLGSSGSAQEMSTALAMERRRVLELEEQCKMKDLQMRELLSVGASASRREEDSSHNTKTSHNTAASASPDAAGALLPPSHLSDLRASLSGPVATIDENHTRSVPVKGDKVDSKSMAETSAGVREHSAWRDLLEEVARFLDFMRSVDHGTAGSEFDAVMQAWQTCGASVMRHQEDTQVQCGGGTNDQDGREVDETLAALSRALQLEHRCVRAAYTRWQHEGSSRASAMQQLQDTLEDERRVAGLRMAEMTAEHEAEVRQLTTRIAQLERTMTGRERSVGVGQVSRDMVAVIRCGAMSDVPTASPLRDQKTARMPGCSSYESANGRTVTRAVQTEQDFITTALQAVRERTTRGGRREREGELLLLALREIEQLQLRLTESELHAAWLEEQRARFLGPVDVPLSYCEGVALRLAGSGEVAQPWCWPGKCRPTK